MTTCRWLPSPDAPEATDTLRALARGCAVLCLVAEGDQPRIAGLQAAARAAGVRIVGGVFPALLDETGFRAHGVWLLRLPPGTRAAILPREGRTTADAAARIATTFHPGLTTAPPTLLLFFDAMTPDVASVLDALYLELADGVHYLGANVGSETFAPMPCLFDDERLVGDAVLGLLMPGSLPSALRHGYHAPEDSVTATATSGNRIAAIRWRPAFEVYQELVAERHALRVERASFYTWAVHMPFGITLANGESLVRIPVGLGEDDSIVCVGEIPNDSLLTVLDAPAPGSTETVAAVADTLAAAGPSEALLCFYCAGRRLHLGESAESELAALQARVTGPVVGALSLGEIGGVHRWSYPLFHNAAIVGIGWGLA